jgi:hypothetical protein
VCGAFAYGWDTAGAVSNAAGARDVACGVDDQAGGGFGFLAGEVGFDADVGVGGEHDAGVAEFVLDDFEVGAGLQGEAGGAVA